MKRSIIIIGLALFALVSCKKSEDSGKLTVGFLLKSKGNQYFVTCEKGAQAAAILETLTRHVPRCATRSRAATPHSVPQCACSGYCRVYSSAVKKKPPNIVKIRFGIQAASHEGSAPLWPSEMQKAARTQ